MKRWHGSWLNTLLVLLVCGESMFLIVPVSARLVKPKTA